MASLQAIAKIKTMKKLLTTALVISAISSFAVVKPLPDVPCDCTGIGMPKKAYPKLPDRHVVSQPKMAPMNLGQYLIYQAELAGWLYFRI
jgi:hypothetical protein